MAKKPAKPTQNEKDAAAHGMSVKAWNDAKKKPSSSSKKSSSSKDSSSSKSSSVAYTSTDAYKSLSQEAKDFVNLSYNAISVGGADEAKLLSNAITQAQAIADPYYKTQLAVMKAEIMGKLAEQNQDFETRHQAIQDVRDQLMQDVKNNSDSLTLEQQADIAREIKGYNEDLLTIADQAAEKGITFATGDRSRALAEERRTAQKTDVVESSTRQYNFKMNELQLRASRGDADAQKQLADLTAKNSFQLSSIGRSAESVLGTANTPAIAGFTPTGGVMGTLEEEKRKAILADTSGFLTLQQSFI